MRTSIRVIAAVVAVVVAAGIAALAPGDARAFYFTDARMNCVELEGFRFELPNAGSQRQSQFVFRVDGGRWQYTNWYYTYNAAWYEYLGGRWEPIRFGGGFLPIWEFADEAFHRVEGWEYRYSYATRSYTWHDLGACTVNTWHGGGGLVLG